MNREQMNSTVKNKSKHTAITIKDHLDDQAITILSEIHNKIKSHHLIFDLSDLRKINSYGSSAWIKFIKSFVNYRIEFHNCSPEFISLCSMLKPARGSGQIVTYQVPYHCEACNKNLLQTFEMLKINRQTDFPKAKCPRCKADIEAETFADEYLANI